MKDSNEVGEIGVPDRWSTDTRVAEGHVRTIDERGGFELVEHLTP